MTNLFKVHPLLVIHYCKMFLIVIEIVQRKWPEEIGGGEVREREEPYCIHLLANLSQKTLYTYASTGSADFNRIM